MRNLLKKAGITGISCLCAFMVASAGNSDADARTRQTKKIYKYKQDKKQVKEFSSIKADFNTLDMVIEKSGSKNFYISYDLNCNNNSNPLSYKIENGVLSIKESGLKWPAVYINYQDKKNQKINYKNYNNKIYVYIPSGTNLKNYNLDIGTGDLFIQNISLKSKSGKITADSGDIDITASKIQGSADINTDSGDIDIRKSVINKTFNIKTGSGDVEIYNSAIKGKLNIRTSSGDINEENIEIYGNEDIYTPTGDIDIKLNSKCIDKLNINLVTKDGDMYIKKSYKGTKREKGDGYKYTRNNNKKPLLNVFTGCGDIGLR